MCALPLKSSAAAHESFHLDQQDAESCACRSHHEQDGSKQLTFVQVYGMLHSLNPSVACAVLLLSPLAKAAEAHYTVLRPLAIEAPIADPEAPAFRPLIITAAEVHCALDVCTTIEGVVDDAAYESFHPD